MQGTFLSPAWWNYCAGFASVRATVFSNLFGFAFYFFMHASACPVTSGEYDIYPICFYAADIFLNVVGLFVFDHLTNRILGAHLSGHLSRSLPLRGCRTL